MSEATCAALTALFPLVLITVAVERRNFPKNLKRLRWLRSLGEYAASFSVVGLVTVVIGVQTNGLELGWALVAWIAFAVATVGLLLTTIVAMAGADAD